MASGQAQQVVNTGAGGFTIVAGDIITVTINGVAIPYTMVAQDATNGIGTAQTQQNIAAGWQAAAPAYTFTPNVPTQTSILVRATSFGDTRPTISVSYSGTGNVSPVVYGPTLIGGDGGASTTVQSTGGAASPAASGPPVVAQGGFISQVGTTFTKNGIG